MSSHKSHAHDDAQLFTMQMRAHTFVTSEIHFGDKFKLRWLWISAYES